MSFFPKMNRSDGNPDRFSIDGIRSHALLQYLGPAFLVTVGFIDPGNWATNIAGGSKFGYTLIWVVTLSTIILILFQFFAARLGIVTQLSLAQNIRKFYPKPIVSFLGITALLANVATDVAEFLGAALGIHLLFHTPIPIAALISGILVFGLIGLQKQGIKTIEHIIIGFISIIGFCYVAELIMVKPNWTLAVKGTFFPQLDSKSIFVAMGILGAIIMPHNIYLHSDVIQHKDWSETHLKLKDLFQYELIDTLLAMGAGWVINSAMIIVAAAVFFYNGLSIGSIEQASATLCPLVGKLASLLFGIALLASGLSSSMTASLASVSVVTGYLGRDVNFVLSRIFTMAPALIIICLGKNTFQLLILSQVILSMQLPFTLIPLLHLTGSPNVMGEYVNKKRFQIMGWIFASAILYLNILLLHQLFRGRF